MLAAGAALLGALAGAGLPAARWWARRNGLTGNLKSLLQHGLRQKAMPGKVDVYAVPVPAKPNAAMAAARAQGATIASALRADATGKAPATDSTVIRIAVPTGTKSQILRAEWDVA